MSSSRTPSTEKLAAIRLLVLDVDGVMTDGQLHYDAQGHEAKVFHVHDGYGIKQLMQAGIEVAVISGRHSTAVATRMAELGIEHVRLGQEIKNQAFTEITTQLGIPPEAVACVGDDEPDLPIMQAAGLSIAVANARPAILNYADWHTILGGGCGAVREVCDALIAAHRGHR
ncbi:MAG: HAD-IIIA family hydrolase [Gammaproteobacteria bacterium]|jgi:3-deoxy-D-manno-octulosonate 8-phosphate phosphatase (KDO 8-P phosphatase)|nr:phenylphosphate carboxylase subunit delta [Chromatiales bacterium]MCP4926874.1 HAD-IIIA family hydrolase [Gammaproteobacteria bacterium]MDP7154386.1 HAD-IIIA family hydrolase [Gammaproteobacteria bacterium]MDP7295891.1 HAD-IIIA family hydrolase [Gammaproteobacteria bacterium]MDP7419864.1 HAD-IIIA family hydrolase [Gammaproteobacteria bacterium]